GHRTPGSRPARRRGTRRPARPIGLRGARNPGRRVEGNKAITSSEESIMGPDDLVYLKKNVIAEPIILGWYAWPQFVTPASLAMNVVGRHLKIMDSYIQSPQLHAEAVKNPKMKGGPFVDYPEDRPEGVRRLRDRTLREQGRLIELAGAIRQLSDLLK